jgi:DNA-binding GntR family transcriptional regulator
MPRISTRVSVYGEVHVPAATGDRQVGYVGAHHKSLRQAVAAELREAILSGRMRPGDRLVEEHLAQMLGVSRNPVREALHVLAADGFVELIPRKGAVVASVSDDEAEDLFDVRSALEELAAGLAARRRSPELLAELEQVLDHGDEVMAAGEIDKVPELNSRFHALLAQASGNSMLASMVHQVRDRMQLVYSARVDVRAAQSWEEHRRILAAIKAGDEQRAAEHAALHVRAARSAYQHPSQTAPASGDGQPA